MMDGKTSLFRWYHVHEWVHVCANTYMPASIHIQVERVMCDWWLAQWSTSSFALSDLTYTMIFVAFVVAYTLLVLVRTLSLVMMLLNASTNLHNAMFVKVLRAPMLFFWSNISGRILNRFTKVSLTHVYVFSDVQCFSSSCCC